MSVLQSVSQYSREFSQGWWCHGSPHRGRFPGILMIEVLTGNYSSGPQSCPHRWSQRIDFTGLSWCTCWLLLHQPSHLAATLLPVLLKMLVGCILLGTAGLPVEASDVLLALGCGCDCCVSLWLPHQLHFPAWLILLHWTLVKSKSVFFWRLCPSLDRSWPSKERKGRKGHPQSKCESCFISNSRDNLLVYHLPPLFLFRENTTTSLRAWFCHDSRKRSLG